MKLPKPTAWVYKTDFGRLMFSSSPTVPHWSFPVFSETQLREALARQAEELKQLQEQNTYIDNIASELENTCNRQAIKLARKESAMRHVLDVLGPQAPECCGCKAEWNEAIQALEEALGSLSSASTRNEPEA